jgi:hypothetical protein
MKYSMGRVDPGVLTGFTGGARTFLTRSGGRTMILLDYSEISLCSSAIVTSLTADLFPIKDRGDNRAAPARITGFLTVPGKDSNRKTFYRGVSRRFGRRDMVWHDLIA